MAAANGTTPREQRPLWQRKDYAAAKRQSEHTLRRLLDAGHAVIRETGYYTSSIDDIVREAGVSRATFYLHFETKADLLRALVIDSLGIAGRSVPLPPHIGNEPDPEAAVRQWLDDIVEFYDRHGSLWDAWDRESARDISLALLRSARIHQMREAAAASVASSPAAERSDARALGELLDAYVANFAALIPPGRGGPHRRDLDNVSRFVARGFFGA